MIITDRQNLFDQSVRNDLMTYNNVRKIATGEGEYYNMIEIDLRKQQAFDFDPKAIQQINFTGNRKEQSTMFFTIEEAKETVLDFSEETAKVV